MLFYWIEDNNLWRYYLCLSMERLSLLHILKYQHKNLFISPLTEIYVLRLGLSHLNWWCSALCWLCSVFVFFVNVSSWMYFISLFFKELSQLIMLLPPVKLVHTLFSFLALAVMNLYMHSFHCGHRCYSVDWLLQGNFFKAQNY